MLTSQLSHVGVNTHLCNQLLCDGVERELIFLEGLLGECVVNLTSSGKDRPAEFHAALDHA